MARTGSRPQFSIIRSMKRPGLTPALASATLFLILSPLPTLSAQENMTGPAAQRASKRADELLKRFDKNGDGKLDDDERAEAKDLTMKEQVDRQMTRAAALPGGLEQFRKEVLEMFDRNRDGRLDDEERNLAQKFAEQQQEGADALKKRFDKNGDGKLDDDERSRVDVYLSALRTLGGGQARAALLRQFDLNSDGKINDAEFVEVEKFVRPRVETAGEQLRLHDTNGDGKLDDAEWAKARVTILQWLNAPAGGGEAAPKYNVAAEQARLEAVAKEVVRRRAIREASAKKTEAASK
jgi:Ca2+-binding EF-hand superfamily protein